MKQIVLVRHGQSTWNLENRFTGWVDVDLSERGIEEARSAGKTLRERGYTFDQAFTSVLKRSIRTLWLIMEEMDEMWLPVHTDWRLNERHYGALQGLNKSETTKKHGEEQVLRWRRGYAVQPPPLPQDDPMNPCNEAKYAMVKNLPTTESLADTLVRVVAYWNEVVVPSLNAGQRPIMVAHGNSLRALIKHLDNISDEEIMRLNIPTGIPLVYELDDTLKPVKHFYLADEDKVSAAVNEVSNQAKAS